MKPFLVLLHGWGYDASFWRPLIEALPDMACTAWDLGYFGTPSSPLPEREAIAIGHSYGVLSLLKNRPFAWRGLVSINGFSRFSQAPDLPEGVPVAQIDRLAASTEEDAPGCLSGFRQWDARPEQPDLVLCGETDKVVPAPFSRALFRNDNTRWHVGGHLLPQQDPEWCAGQIRTWLKRAK
jgi:pimeloyl-[acyl-carrier protein] methyl ester esterase